MSARYCAVSAKLKAMSRGSMKRRDFEEILAKPTVKDIFDYLRTETMYGESLAALDGEEIHRRDVEAHLKNGLLHEFGRIYEFLDLNQKKLLEYWFMRYEVEYLKNSLRYIFNGEDDRTYELHKGVAEFFSEHTKIDAGEAVKALTLDEFIKACAGSPYYAVLERAKSIDADCFSICMMLDRFYYIELWRAKDKYLTREEADIFANLVGSRIDMLNMIWIYRGKKYFNFDPDMMFTYIIPVRNRLTPDNIKAMVGAKNAAEMTDAVKATKYAPLFDMVAEDGYYAEEQFRRLCKKDAARIMNTRPLSMAAIFAYLYMREAEIDDITTVIEGVRYGLSPEQIRQHIF